MSKLEIEINKVINTYNDIIINKGFDLSLLVYKFDDNGDSPIMVDFDKVKPVDDYRLYLVYESLNTGMHIATFQTESEGYVWADTDSVDDIQAYDYDINNHGHGDFIPTGLNEFLKGVTRDINKGKLKDFLDGE